MDRPEMPEDIKIAKREREKDLRIDMVRAMQVHAYALLFPGDIMSHVDNALGIDRKAILRTALIDLAGTLDENLSVSMEEAELIDKLGKGVFA
jgi:hypothetical protein